MEKRISFIKFIKIWGVIFLITLAVVFIGYDVVDNYKEFNNRAEKMREEYITRQKEMIKQEVMQAVDLINFKKETNKAEEQIERKLLKTISRVRFGKEGYIFINRLNGDALVSNGKVLSGRKKLWEVFNSNEGKMKELFQLEYDAAIKPNGDYIYYSFIKLSDFEIESPKVSFIFGIKDLQWLVGAGVYLDDIEEDILLMKNDLKENLKEKLLYSIIVVVVVIALFLFIFNAFFNKLKDDFNLFEQFFENAAYKDESIDIESFKFTLLVKMAKSANNMLKDKNKAQQELIDEREQLFVTIRSVGDALITTDAMGRVDLMNRVAEKLTGWKNGEAKGKDLTKIFNLINEKNREQVKNPVNKVLDKNRIVGLANHSILISKDGTEYNISDSAAPIRDVNNNVRGVVLVFRDITEEYRIQEELKESEKRYSRLSELTYESIIIHKNGIALDVNKAFEKMSGYPAKEIIGKNVIQLFVLEKYHKVMITNLHNKIISPYEVEGINRDGEVRKLEVESRDIGYKINGENIRVTAIRDITEKSKMLDELILSKEKAENADKMKSIFLAQMSHEIRTPINALVSMSSLLRYDFEDNANDDQIMSFDVIDSAGVRIIRTIDLLLNLSEIQAGTYEVLPTQFDIVSDVLSIILAEYKKPAIRKNIKLSLERSTSDTKLVADSYTVTQIFTQLIDNAIKYTEVGEVTIKILRSESEQLIIEIADTGIGIDELYLPDLFEPFSQEEMGYTRKFEGNGIGMALVNKYCELNNAKIEVESKKGKGSTFRIAF